MSVIPLTVFFSLLLAGLFTGLFAHERRHRRFASAERDSLLPLADETPHTVSPDHQEDEDPDVPAGPKDLKATAALSANFPAP